MAVPIAGPPEMRLPGYSDFQLIAEGGEGTVYRARQDGLGRYVAVKVINVGDPARLARFRRELEITVRLGRAHPHIVTVIDTGTAPSGLPCIVMEYYDLGSLYDRLRQLGPLPVEEVTAAGIAVADALAFAHGQGFLHRDVKPQNILLLPTSYVLADFGIARMTDAGHTTSLQMVSYRHAAPQMIDGQSPAAADDLWSLGSTLFTLLDGAPPFSTENPDEDTMLSYLDRVRGAPPRPVRRPDLPPELAGIITRCLSKRREDRFPDAAALRAALSAVDTGAPGWTPSLPVADFGPRPTPVADPAPPAPPVLDSERTMLGPRSDLAGLTVRLTDDRTSLPDFGPGSGDPAPSLPAAWFITDPDPAVSFTPVRSPALPPGAAPRVRRPRNRLRILVLALTAVVVGGAIGLAATWLNQIPPSSSTPPPPSVSLSISPSATIPAGGDPAFAPTLNRVDDQGATITLTWTDPTNGKAQFVVVDVTGDRPQPLATIVAGVTTHTINNLDPAAPQYCFQIVAIGLADPTTQRGASARTCAVR
ncbi:MAG TPA: protein kinase [Actinophytocola sp.]|uniref:serine/threonine-protein kinase n=1 Tax=Actinophytocola sp. TaxID=1872138 RepID=UPI002DB9E4E9|nr:protein kinase [Actinophytocola sp.]HEU5469094.1 protein kinase [Actinophytocola sp.]